MIRFLFLDDNERLFVLLLDHFGEPKFFCNPMKRFANEIWVAKDLRNLVRCKLVFDFIDERIFLLLQNLDKRN